MLLGSALDNLIILVAASDHLEFSPCIVLTTTDDCRQFWLYCHIQLPSALSSVSKCYRAAEAKISSACNLLFVLAFGSGSPGLVQPNLVHVAVRLRMRVQCPSLRAGKRFVHRNGFLHFCRMPSDRISEKWARSSDASGGYMHFEYHYD